jgi:Tol biopolymer transport system component
MAVTSAPAETARSTAEAGPVADAPCSFGVPMNLGPELNAPGFDGGPTPSFDGLRLYFVSDRSGSQGGDIWVSARPAADAAFGSPENLGPGVNGEGDEGAPSLSPDELVIVFDRDDGGIWAATRPAIDAPFGIAERLSGSVNIPFAGFPALSADGLTLHFASEREGGQGGMDLWRATRGAIAEPFGTVENLGSSVNGPSDDAMATVSADDLRIVFASTREGGMGDWDLWMADRPDAESGFVSPVNLGPDVNTEGFEGRPHLTSDGSVLMFMSDRPGGQGTIDLWQVTIDCSTG